MIITRKFNRNSNKELPIPGSLEETLQFPDSYLNAPRYSIDNIKQTAEFPKIKRILNPMDVYRINEMNYRINAKDESHKIIKNIIKSRMSSISGINFKCGNKLSKSKPELSPITNKKLMDQYIRIKLKLKSDLTSSLNSTKINNKEFEQSRQERYLYNYKVKKCDSDRTIHYACDSVGRNPSNSIILQSNLFKEKLEKRSLSSSTQFSILQGTRAWYMNLRNSEGCKDSNHFGLIIGNGENKLWMRIAERPSEIVKETINKKTFNIFDIPSKKKVIEPLIKDFMVLCQITK